MKRKYIKPIVKSVAMLSERPFAEASATKEGNLWSGSKFSALSREGDASWDDDDEEEDSMWK